MHVPNKENIYSGRIVKLMCSKLDLTVVHPPALNLENKIMKFVNLDPGKYFRRCYDVKLTKGKILQLAPGVQTDWMRACACLIILLDKISQNTCMVRIFIHHTCT